MIRSLSALLARPAAFAGSVALHVTALVAGGHALAGGADDRALAGAPLEIDIEIAGPRLPDLPAPMPAEDAPTARAGRPVNVGHRHSYPVPPDHDARPHHPSVVHLGRSSAEVPAAPLVAQTSVEEPLHFVLAPVAGLATRDVAARDAHGSSATNSGTAGSDESDGGATFAESAVDDKARLSSSVPVIYPEAARAAGLEADVRLELVVDAEGRVVSARPLAAPALGLDEAALRAVQAYRFSPARRAGRPVRVRMQWTVAFRLQ
jgi:periplasmic protein TonB